MSNSEIQPYVLDLESNPEAEGDLCTQVTLIKAVRKTNIAVAEYFLPDPTDAKLLFFLSDMVQNILYWISHYIRDRSLHICAMVHTQWFNEKNTLLKLDIAIDLPI